jgi:hypothetical protein
MKNKRIYDTILSFLPLVLVALMVAAGLFGEIQPSKHAMSFAEALEVAFKQ